jgi:murein DD-endopeptidase MepM/ murein hydrolase activator NlpD
VALLPPIKSAKLTQGFGPSALTVEPPMFANATKATFSNEAGLAFHAHFHPALDLSANPGTQIVASEAGKVLFSGFDTSGGGNKVQVEIRPNVSYASNHCQDLLVKTGAVVIRGQPIATVGATGAAFGAHDHFWVEIKEVVGGALRNNYHNPALFLPGGSMADSELIKPLTPATIQFVRLNGAHINIRTKPTLQLSTIFATSKDDGIQRLGKVIAPLDARMRFGGFVSGDGLIWALVHFAGGRRFVAKDLMHFVGSA